MPTLKLPVTTRAPLSGDVTQLFNQWAALFSPMGNQVGLVNINLGVSSDPKVEEDVLSDVGTYGKQLGRIGDALIVLLAHFHPQKKLSKAEAAAIDALKEMLNEVADVKESHGRPALRP